MPRDGFSRADLPTRTINLPVHPFDGVRGLCARATHDVALLLANVSIPASRVGLPNPAWYGFQTPV